MRYFLQVLSTGSESLSPCFMLLFDNTRFLFNCGEGMQRYLTQHKIRLVRLNTLLLTRLSWSHLGGLPGLILSASDAGSSGMSIIGPYGTDAFIKSLYPFIRRSSFPVEIQDVQISAESELFGSGQTLEASPLKISTFQLNSTKTSSKGRLPPVDEKSSGMFKAPSSSPPKKICVRDFPSFHEEVHLEEDLSQLNENLSTVDEEDDGTRLGDVVACYLIQCPDRPGKFQAAKAEALGIFGARRGQLARGQPIVLEDGTIIRPSDVIDPHVQGKRIFVIEIPTEEYIVNNQPFFALEIFSDIDLVIFILGDTIELSSGSTFKSWFDGVAWKSGCQHIIFKGNSHDKPALFPSSELLSLFLRQKCEFKYFPLLSTAAQEKISIPFNNATQALPLMRIFLEPAFSIHHPEPMNLSSIIRTTRLDLLSLPEQRNSLEENSYPSLVFLGTGSAIPSKYRNVSSIMLQVSAKNSVLFDCGEGTLGQLARIFSDKLNDVLSTISCIFISHLHADHHLGLIGILRAIHNTAPSHSLTIIAPLLLSSWIKLYSQYFEHFLPNIRFMASQSLLDGKQIIDDTMYVQTCPMRHIPSSFGLVLKIQREVSIAYSGDTRPCELFSRLLKSNNIKVLIHEATFEDDLEAQAIPKAHSTWGEAISMAHSACVPYLILTHFSQRYSVASPPSIATKVPLNRPIVSAENQSGTKVLHAIFDMMKLPLDQLDNYYELQNARMGDIEAQFTEMKKSIGPDSDVEEEIKFT